MANVYATKSGNWSDTTLWNTLALPTTVDDVWSNNFIVYVDGNFRVVSVRNKATTGITAGGGFILNDGVSLSANVEGSGVTGGSNACVRFLSAAPSFATIVGNISSNNTAIQVPVAVFHNGTGTLNIVGNCLGGTNNNTDASNGYIDNSSTGTINISGNVIGGSTLIFGIDNNSTGTINVTGNVTGGAGFPAIYVSVGGNINIRGNLTGQGTQAILNNGTRTTNILVSGNVTANTAGCIQNNSFGNLTVYGNVFGGQSVPANREGIINSGICTIYGNVAGGPEGAGGVVGNNYGVNNSGICTIYGNVSGAAVTASLAYGVLNSGRVDVVGDVRGRFGQGLINNSTGTVNITGNVIGGTNTNTHGMQNSTTAIGTINVLGNAIGGTAAGAVGIVNNIGGRVIVNGNAIANVGSLSYGVAQNGTGYVEVNGLAIGNGWGLGSSGIGGATPGIIGSQTGTTIIRGLSCGARGQWPTAGVVFIIPQSTSTATFETSAFQDVNLFTSLSTNIVPPASSVKIGTKYNLNQSTGTCSMPSISSVLQGVSVDNSIGIAALQPQTIWNYSVLSATDVDSLGGRLKEVATVQSVGQQLTALN